MRRVVMVLARIRPKALLGVLLILCLGGVCLGGMGLARAQPLEGRLKTISETETLRIAYRHDSRPFSYLDAQGRPSGYSIELCERIAKSIERQLGVRLAINWIQVDTRTRFDRMVDGSTDIECGSTTISLSRMKIVDFSNVIFAESTGVLVKAGRRIFSFDDMAGRKIGIVPGSTNAHAIRNQLQRRKIEATLVELNDREEGIAALVRGELDGFATDKLVLLAMSQALNLRDHILLPEDLSFEPFGIMLPRGDWAMRLAVNTGLAEIFRSGDIIELYTKHFSSLSRGASNWVGAVFIFGGLPE
jgi:glutamate/aspartate transport system substrate-binding protein